MDGVDGNLVRADEFLWHLSNFGVGHPGRTPGGRAFRCGVVYLFVERELAYLYAPDEIDRERANHRAVIQGADDIDAKRIGNLGELAVEQFCREYPPVEMWNLKNEEAMRRCNPESFAGHDLRPNTAHLNQEPENPFRPGDRVVDAGDDASPAVV